MKHWSHCRKAQQVERMDLFLSMLGWGSSGFDVKQARRLHRGGAEAAE